MQISEETKQRVLDAASALGYVPDAAAQALASGRSKTIGLLLARRLNVIATDMYLTQVIEVLVSEVNRNGMRLLLEVVENYEDRESYLRLARSNSIDGVLYSGPRFEDTALRYLVDHGIPTVLMGALPGTPYAYVDIDNRQAAFQAVEHLVHLGHTRIACITNALPTYVAATERLHGYQDALRAAGIHYDPALVRYGDFDPESGYRQMKSLLSDTELPSAVFVASDVVAFGAMHAIREQGLVIPRDIALAGFDDVTVSRYIEPSLTTVRLPVVELARCACEMLIAMIQKETPTQSQVLLEARLIVRASCGAQAGGNRPNDPFSHSFSSGEAQ
jgi:LacI family transcriptional regulator